MMDGIRSFSAGTTVAASLSRRRVVAITFDTPATRYMSAFAPWLYTSLRGPM